MTAHFTLMEPQQLSGLILGSEAISSPKITIMGNPCTQCLSNTVKQTVAQAVLVAMVGVVKAIDDVQADEMILDIGPVTARDWAASLMDAQTILWNGPVGVFEFPQFGQGTKIIGEAITASSAFSIAGGGDTLAAVEQYDLANGVSYISTGGGAFLELVEGKVLPAVAVLGARCAVT